jgi:putative salt-induced outer membrane protein YdiY
MMTIKMHTGLFAAILLSLAGAVSVRAQTNTAPEQMEPPWIGSVSTGVTLTRGNSDTLMATMSAVAGKKWGQNELSFGADGTYGEAKPPGATNSIVNANAVHGLVQYNRLFSERLFGYGRVDALHDEVAAIRYRVSLGPGVGYYFIKAVHTDLSAELGPGYVVERLGSDNSSYATLRIGEKFHHTLNDHVRLWQTFEWLPQVDKFNNYIINAEIGVEADLTKTKKLTLRSFLQDTYNNVPATGRRKNDVKLVTALAYKF